MEGSRAATLPHSQDTDSGYSSLQNTPPKASSANSLEGSYIGVATTSHRFFPNKVARAKVFEKEIPRKFQNRFCDLRELFDASLYDYLSKAKSKEGAISIRLKSVGQCEATAKPTILVLCDRKISRQVKKFFAQPQVKSEYQPSDPYLDLPRFQLCVGYQSPKRLSATEGVPIYGPAWTDSSTPITLCGTRIRVGDNQDLMTVATIGGVIKTTPEEGRSFLYGLTVGHIVPDACIGVEEDGVSANETAEDQDDRPTLDDYFELELTDDESEAERQNHTRTFNDGVGESEDGLSSIHDRTSEDHIHERAALPPNDLAMVHWQRIGSVSAPCCERLEDGQNLDWALVTINDLSYLRPNLVQRGSRSMNLTEYLHEPIIGQNRHTAFIVGMSGHKLGRLSTLPSYLMLAPGTKLIEAYTITLTDGSDFEFGDCGAWVVNARSYKVYGHVVATDVLNEAYVVPLHSTFRQMKKHLPTDSVKSISLPTPEEVEDFIAQASKSSQSRSGKRRSAPESDNSTPDTGFLMRKRRKRRKVSRVERGTEDDEPHHQQQSYHSASSMSQHPVPLTTSHHDPTTILPLPSTTATSFTSVTRTALRGTSSPWNAEDDEILVRSRAAGLGWGQIQEQYFQAKSANACRKRFGKVMQKRKGGEWDEASLRRLAIAYRDMRESIWKPLAEQLNEPRWESIEKACMERGLKNLQTIAEHPKVAKRPIDANDPTSDFDWEGDLVPVTIEHGRSLLDNVHADSGFSSLSSMSMALSKRTGSE